jgi:hypothetical protein
MIVTLTLIVGASIGVGSAVVGGVVGFLVGNRRRNSDLDENYQRMIEYYSQPEQPQYETEQRSVFTRL